MKNLLLFLCSFLLAAALQAQIIHVPADYLTIQQGINAANPGDTVLVADGTYTEQINFLGKKPLMVASEFIIDGNESHISSTIIDGSQAPNPDSASVVYFISGEDSTSVLCGFTITGGKGTYLPVFPDLEAGGILVWNSGAKFRNNMITGNTLDDSDYPESAGAYGGAACCYSYDQFGTYTENWIIFENNEISGNAVTTDHLYAFGGGLACIGNIILRHNTIEGNSSIQTTSSTGSSVGSGGLLCEGEPYPVSDMRIQDNKISNNTISAVNPDVTNSIGAGAFFKSVKLTCSGNEFTGNKITDPANWVAGGGMNCESLALGSVISGNTFRNNVSTNLAGGMFVGWTHGYMKIENNYFFNNSAKLGGAFASYYSTLQLQNNVFYHNNAGLSGGAVYLTGEDAGSYHTVCLVNNTFNENKAKYAGALTVNLVNALVLNSIFWQDSAATDSREISINYPTFEIAFSNIDSSCINYAVDYIYGEGNINMNPLFADTLLNLAGLSPCINTGTDVVTCHGVTWEAPLYDIDNLLRPDPEAFLFDMGAHEFGSIGVGVNESAVGSRQSAVRVYPNPTGGMVNFQFTNYNLQSVTLKVFDIHGREVATVVDGKWSGDQVVRWDASVLPAGIYFYRLVGGQRSAVGKIIKF